MIGLAFIFISCLHIESVGITSMNEYMFMKLKNVKTYAYSPGFMIFIIAEATAHVVAQSILQIIIAKDGAAISNWS